MKSTQIKLLDAVKMLIKEKHPDAKVPGDSEFEKYNRDGDYNRLFSRYQKAITRAAASGDLHWKGHNVVDRSEYVVWARGRYRVEFRGEPITDSQLGSASCGDTFISGLQTVLQGPPLPSRPSLSDTMETAIGAYDEAMALYRDVDMQRHRLQVDANQVQSMIKYLRQSLEGAVRLKARELRTLIDAAQHRHHAVANAEIAQLLDSLVQHLSWHERNR